MSEVIRIRGAVQGVGFRPTVARLARARGLDGFVRNDAHGVLIGLAVDEAEIVGFLDALMRALPPLARVESVERETAEVRADGFRIEASATGTPRAEVTPDAATCEACRDEVRDRSGRRLHYPFTTCTHCGPRYSIVTAIPYDRAHTTMASFPLCADCHAEYDDEADRRYHAQPLACAACGPAATLERMDGEARATLDEIGGLLASGAIVALKGIGGYQLCCDATNEHAVETLRARKRRPHKPFAVMVGDIAMAARFVSVTDAERALLESPAAPIVLCARRASEAYVAPGVAPDQSRLGVMLPTSPLHQRVLEGLGRPMVCTSGNVSDEPQAIDDDDARARLAPIADWCLAHDRPIRNRVDDSVLATFDGAPRMLRRARGYAPAPIPMPPGFAESPDLVALGGDLKACFALLSQGRAVLSPHLGELEHAAAFAAYGDTFALMSELFGHAPTHVAHDAHPAYRAHAMGRDLAGARGLAREEVLHHHAHIASCLVDNGWARDAGPVLGLALDGLGLGEQGALWGCELLRCDYVRAKRLGTLEPVALLGGDKAARQPWRNLYAQLRAQWTWPELERALDVEAVAYLRGKRTPLLEQVLDHTVLENTALAAPSSSAGRLFDAVAAAVGIAREGVSYEGEAAMRLECLVTDAALAAAKAEPYPLPISEGDLLRVELRAFWEALLADLRAGAAPARVSARFHVGFAVALAMLVERARARTGLCTVALSGGCFQNRVLVETLAHELRARGFDVLLHRQVPPHDGGLALGQAAVAAARCLAREER